MKTILVSLLLLTLALNSYANDVVALQSNNPPLTGELAGIKECQIAEISEDGVLFTSFFYKEKSSGQGIDVHSIVTSESARVKAFAQPVLAEPKISVVNPPDQDMYNLTFDGSKNKDKSKVLDLSLKLCLAKKQEKKLVDINAFLQKELVKSYEVIGKIPQAIGQAYQFGYLQGLSQNTMASFILGRQVGQIEGLIVGYQKGKADALGKDSETKALVASLEVIDDFNNHGMDRQTPPQWASKSSFANSQGAFTRAMKNRQGRGDNMVGDSGSVDRSK